MLEVNYASPRKNKGRKGKGKRGRKKRERKKERKEERERKEDGEEERRPRSSPVSIKLRALSKLLSLILKLLTSQGG